MIRSDSFHVLTATRSLGGEAAGGRSCSEVRDRVAFERVAGNGPERAGETALIGGVLAVAAFLRLEGVLGMMSKSE